MRIVISLLAGLAATGLLACRADLSDLQTVSVEDVAEWRAGNAVMAVCDANSDDTRKRYGVVPDAVLLTNYRDYDVATELPADRSGRLVFYCHSEMCGAAGDAARKAVKAGYRDVWVMAPGIQGWAEAGQPIDHPERVEREERENS